jgi:hypothetical protein
MESFWRIVGAVGDTAAIAVLISGLCAFILREKIKQYFARGLAHDLEDKKAALARDHAAYSAELGREMEAYRVSLIAEAEKLKASQQLKTALALKVGERRYTAVCEIHDAFAGRSTTVLAIANSDFQGQPAPQHYQQIWRASFESVQKSGDVLSLVGAYLSSDLQSAALDLQKKLLEVSGARPEHRLPRVPEDSGLGIELLRAGARFDALVAQELRAFELPH